MAPDLIRIELIDSRHQRISCHLQRGGSPDAGVEIGRGREAGLPIDDETVSRRQAIVRVDPEGRIFIRDLESRSESSVNWMIMDSNEEVRLRHGDRLGFGSAEVTVAHALSKEQQQELKTALKDVTGKDVALDITEDASLLGGMIVQVGSRQIDTSLRTKLSTLKHALKEVG